MNVNIRQILVDVSVFREKELSLCNVLTNTVRNKISVLALVSIFEMLA